MNKISELMSWPVGKPSKGGKYEFHMNPLQVVLLSEHAEHGFKYKGGTQVVTSYILG